MSDEDLKFWITKEQVQTLMDYAHRYDSLGLMVVAQDVLKAPMQAVHDAAQQQAGAQSQSNDDESTYKLGVSNDG